MNEETIEVTFGEILDSGNWDRFCADYGYNLWMINEGLATRRDEVEIDLDDFMDYGIMDARMGR